MFTTHQWSWFFGGLYKTEQDIPPIKTVVSMKVYECVKLVFMIISLEGYMLKYIYRSFAVIL